VSAGSVKRDASGKWAFVVDLPSADGKRRQVKRRGFDKKADAEREMRKVLDRSDAGNYVEPSRLTVATYLTDQWPPAIGSRVRPTTIDVYKRNVATHIVPELGTVRLQGLDRARVTAFVSTMIGKGLSPKTVRNVHAILSKSLADAVRSTLVMTNVASDVDLPRLVRQPPRAWTAADLSRFLAHVEADRLAPLWRFLAITGCRRGEALGLRWFDTDLDAGRGHHHASACGGRRQDRERCAEDLGRQPDGRARLGDDRGAPTLAHGAGR
jgi:integrase